MSERRVAIVCGAGYVFGKEMMALELATGLHEEKILVELVASLWNDGDFVGRLKNLGITTHLMRLGFISASLNWSCIRMTADQMTRWPGLLEDYRRFLKTSRPRWIIHTNWHHLLLLWPFLKPNRDLFWLHESIPDKPQYRQIFSWLSKRLGCFIPVSHAVARSLRQIGISSQKIHVIQNGITDPAPSSEGRNMPQKLRLGIVGQVGVWKGHEDLLEAIFEMNGGIGNLELHIFGSGTKAFEEKLKQCANELGIDERVIWHGFVPNRSAIYREMDICVVPSRAPDPFPTVALESAFFGLPVIASNRGGLPEIIQDGVTGFLFEAEKPHQLAEKLDILLKDPELRAKMGQAARERALNLFSRERFVNDFLKLLRDGEPAR